MNKDFYEKCDLYLSNDLPKDEMEAFEQSLKADPSLAAELESFKSIQQSLAVQIQNEEADKKLEDTLSGFGEQYFGKPTEKEAIVIPFWKKYRLTAIAVAALLILVFGLNYLLNPTTLYHQYAKHPIASFVTLGDNDQLRSEAEQAFNNKDYTKALEKFNALIENNPADNEYVFFRGICALELNSFESAKEIFQQLSEGNSMRKNDATWYLALVWLKQENFENCKTILQNIDSNSSHSEKAQALLKELP